MQIERETSDLVAHNNWSRLVNKLHLSADYRMWVSTNPSLQTVQCILSDTKDHQVSVGMGKGINCMPILGAEFESVEHFFYSSQTHLSTQRMFVSQIIEQDFDFTNDPALNLISKNTKVTVDSFTDIENSRPYNLMCKDEQFLKVNQNWV
ncbi:MAG: hypothetical protein SOI62_06045 [Lactobacillus sp.]